jgi:alpha-glucoside transport system permease protein
MTTTVEGPPTEGPRTIAHPEKSGQGSTGIVYRFLRSIPTWVLWLIVLVWCIPTFGLLVNSFRGRDAQRSSGWWTIFSGNLSGFTLDNYRQVLAASAQGGMKTGLANSLAIALPATIIPIAIAAFAAYAFAWIDFKGRQGLFIVTVSLLAVPTQVALIPLLQMYVRGAHLTIPGLDKTITIFPDLNLAGTTTAVWLTHAAFAMPFAIFLIHNYISSLPRDLFEAARIDGANHFKIFYRLVLPLSVPVLAAFAIFQFLWTWNDYLIALTMVGANPSALPATVKIASQAGEFGRLEHLLTAGAFLQAAVPLAVFFLLQRFFVRGILAGSVKG